MQKFYDSLELPTPSELESRYGEEAATYALTRSQAAAEAGNEEASGRWRQLAALLRDGVIDEKHGE